MRFLATNHVYFRCLLSCLTIGVITVVQDTYSIVSNQTLWLNFIRNNKFDRDKLVTHHIYVSYKKYSKSFLNQVIPMSFMDTPTEIVTNTIEQLTSGSNLPHPPMITDTILEQFTKTNFTFLTPPTPIRKFTTLWPIRGQGVHFTSSFY